MWSLPFSDGKADRRILKRGDQREFAGQTLAERLLVVGDAGPGLLLRLAVVVAGQLLDGGGKIAASTGVSAGRNGRKRVWGASVPSPQNTPNSFSASTAARSPPI